MGFESEANIDRMRSEMEGSGKRLVGYESHTKSDSSIETFNMK